MDDYQSEFSTIEKKVIASIPRPKNIDDAQSTFTNDIDLTSNNFSNYNNYRNVNNYNNTPVVKTKKIYYHENIENSDDSPDELASGYSSYFSNNLKNNFVHKNNRNDNFNITNTNNISNYQNNNYNIIVNQSPNYQDFSQNNQPIKYQNVENPNYITYGTPTKIYNYEYTSYNSYMTPRTIQEKNYNTHTRKLTNNEYNNYISYKTPQKMPNYANENIINIIPQSYSSFEQIKVPQNYSSYYTIQNFNLNEYQKKKLDMNEIKFPTKVTKINNKSRPLFKNDKEESTPQNTAVEETEEVVEQESDIFVNNNELLENKIRYSNQNDKGNITKEELISKCRKNGTPPPDDDFSMEGWKLFYPPDEKFFLWNKGKVIPNQLRINNENDDENLEIYEGEVNKNDEFHGFGIMTTPKFVRKGTWRDGEFTGWCRESRVNGDIYEGKFIDGSIYGKGINKSHKGNLYVGDFVDNKREGQGELRTKRINYVGEFKNNKLNGKGKIKFLKEGHSYEGDFVNNEITGVGVFKWNNGDIFEGEMKNGVMDGYGKYSYSNGQIYEGNYLNGVKHGIGKMIYPNNKVYEGEFKNGKPEGEGVIYMDGKKIDVIFKDGKFHKK